MVERRYWLPNEEEWRKLVVNNVPENITVHTELGMQRKEIKDNILEKLKKYFKNPRQIIWSDVGLELIENNKKIFLSNSRATVYYVLISDGVIWWNIEAVRWEILKILCT
jgi:hypothetical protein